MTQTKSFVLSCRQNPSSRFCISRETSILGRSFNCDFVIDDVSVSRKHAEIRLVKAGFEAVLEIEDLGSRNGTFVGDIPVQTSTLILGQHVRFGNIDYELILRDPTFEEHTDNPVPVSGQVEGKSGIYERVLTKAQYRVFQLLREGLPDKLIAKELDLSPHTVHNHTRAIFQLIGVHSRFELLAILAKSTGRMIASRY
ncbi:MAG TPA: FHA domain-containing protein [Gemmata sp.]|jgi:DNA-binding CsgD family transcriptional regulator|nr:FHA domain-containing protein [Gemmata sp.]